MQRTIWAMMPGYDPATITWLNQLSTPPANGIVFCVDKFLKQLQDMTKDRNVILDIDLESREFIAKSGYDKLYGARPLARVITETIKKPLARLMLTGHLSEGGTAEVRVVDNKITVKQ